MAQNQKMAETKQKADTVRQALLAMKPQLAQALPKHLTPDRLMRVTMTAVQNNPRLLDCDRRSLYSAIITCAQLGLEPDGVLGQAYLVPFKVGNQMKVQFIPGYKGYLTLARNSGEVSSIQAHEVCEHDEFSYAYGLEEHLSHRPAEGERGEVTHFYAYAKYKDGGHIFEVLTRAQVDAVRDNSEGYKAFKAGRIRSTPWGSHYVQMGRKTAIRRLANYLPMSVQRAAALDAAYEDGGKAGHITHEGDIVIEGDSEVVAEDETAQEEATAAATSKLDALADNDDADSGEAEPEQEPEPKKTTKPKRGRPKKNKEPEPDEPAPEPEPSRGATVKSGQFRVEDGEVVDMTTGEIVPDKHVKWFDEGGFSVLKSYHEMQGGKRQDSGDRPSDPDADEDGGLFSDEG